MPFALLARFVVSKAIQAADGALILGAIAGWIGLLGGGTADAVGEQSAHFFPVLVVLVPGLFVWFTFPPLRQFARSARAGSSTVAQIVAIASLATGILGAVLGILFYLIVAMYIPIIFSLFRMSSLAVRDAVLSRFRPEIAILVVVVAIVVALIQSVLILMRGQSKSSRV